MVDEAAQRELREKAGVDDVYLEQLYNFGALDRDPRERVVTVAYYALAKLSDHRIRATTDAMGVGWFALDDLPSSCSTTTPSSRAPAPTSGCAARSATPRSASSCFPPRLSLTQLVVRLQLVVCSAFAD
jgi:NUDIX domain-containing protein